MYTKGDFHMHTTNSDGEYTPTEVVIMGKEKGLDIMAITDHNTMNGVEEAIEIGKMIDVKIIPGMELSTRHKGKKIHILGYFMNDGYKDEVFQNSLKYMKSHDMKGLKNLIGNKVFIDFDCMNSRVCTQTGIDFLRHFGATVVLAHPVKIKPYILEEILNMQLDGIEAIYWKNSQDETDYFKKIAKEKGWFYTAGSDFHTDKRLDKRHGRVGDVFLNKEEIEKFLNRGI